MTDSKERRRAAQNKVKAARKALAAAEAAANAACFTADGSLSFLDELLSGATAAPAVDAVGDARKALAAAEAELDDTERLIARRGLAARRNFMAAMGDRYGF